MMPGRSNRKPVTVPAIDHDNGGVALEAAAVAIVSQSGDSSHRAGGGFPERDYVDAIDGADGLPTRRHSLGALARGANTINMRKSEHRRRHRDRQYSASEFLESSVSHH
jgi:hypothetical protein